MRRLRGDYLNMNNDSFSINGEPKTESEPQDQGPQTNAHKNTDPNLNNKGSLDLDQEYGDWGTTANPNMYPTIDWDDYINSNSSDLKTNNPAMKMLLPNAYSTVTITADIAKALTSGSTTEGLHKHTDHNVFVNTSDRSVTYTFPTVSSYPTYKVIWGETTRDKENLVLNFHITLDPGFYFSYPTTMNLELPSSESLMEQKTTDEDDSFTIE